MERGKTNTKTAGVDVGKRWLDAAIHGDGAPVARFGNDRQGVSDLIVWLKAREVGRIGMEATGGEGLSGFPCVGGHNGKKEIPICPDAKSLR